MTTATITDISHWSDDLNNLAHHNLNREDLGFQPHPWAIGVRWDSGEMCYDVGRTLKEYRTFACAKFSDNPNSIIEIRIYGWADSDGFKGYEWFNRHPDGYGPTNLRM